MKTKTLLAVICPDRKGISAKDRCAYSDCWSISEKTANLITHIAFHEKQKDLAYLVGKIVKVEISPIDPTRYRVWFRRLPKAKVNGKALPWGQEKAIKEI